MGGFYSQVYKPYSVPPTYHHSFILWLPLTLLNILSITAVTSQNFQELKLELSAEEEKILYYVAGYLVFPC